MPPTASLGMWVNHMKNSGAEAVTDVNRYNVHVHMYCFLDTRLHFTYVGGSIKLLYAPFEDMTFPTLPTQVCDWLCSVVASIAVFPNTQMRQRNATNSVTWDMVNVLF